MDKLDNFYFCRPEAYSVHPDLGILFFEKDDTFFKWKKLQQYLFDNYDIPEYYNGKFNFIAYGSPLYGVVDGFLHLIPFEGDDRIKPELVEECEDMWRRMNDESCDNHIKGFAISQLYKLFDLDNYRDLQSNYKAEGNVITYKHEHTYYKNW